MQISGETARLRADSPESVLFANSSILPLALKELKDITIYNIILDYVVLYYIMLYYYISYNVILYYNAL